MDIDFYVADAAVLGDRMLAFQQTLPSRDAPTSRAMAAAMFEEARSIAIDVKGLMKKLDAGRRLKGVRFDYDFPSYDRFVEQERAIERDLALLPSECFVFAIDPARAGHAADLKRAPTADDGEAGTRKWIAKLFAALGVGDFYAAMLEVLDEDRTLKLLLDALRRREMDSVRTFLRMLMRFIGSREFLRKLAQKIGQSAAARLVGKILGRCLPFIGWALLIGGIIWAIAEQFL